MALTPPIDKFWVCKKCGYGDGNPPPVGILPYPLIRWSPDRLNTVTISCRVCGWSDVVPQWQQPPI